MAIIKHRNSFQRSFRTQILLFVVIYFFQSAGFFSKAAQAQEVETTNSSGSTDSMNTPGSDNSDVIEAEIVKSQPTKKESAADKDIFDEKKIDFAGLARLSSFKDIAILQKRFLPKTKRFQFNLGLNSVTNNSWFIIGGYDVRLSYFFSESWGIEANYWGVSTSEKQLTKDMNSIQGIKTASLLFPKSYTGLDVMFIPFYGKMSWLDRRIVPFDLYFAAGVGKTLTNYDGRVSDTLHLATGQIFAITKSWAFRWDFSLNNYVAKGRTLTSDNTVGGEISQAINDLYLNIGISWFFPGAKYR